MKQKLFASVPRYLVLCGCSFVVVFAAIAVLQSVLEVFAWGSVALVIWPSLSYTHFALAQEDQERLERYFLGWFWNF